MVLFFTTGLLITALVISRSILGFGVEIGLSSRALKFQGLESGAIIYYGFTNRLWGLVWLVPLTLLWFRFVFSS